MIQSAEYYLYKKDFVTTVEQYHERKKSNPNAENEKSSKRKSNKIICGFYTK